ncbi:MAG: S49 family peptidase [Patescibacteria group bacterium]|jgi:signal peptide peptidase SppA
MNNQHNNPDSDDDSNVRFRKDLRTIKRIIFNKNYLIVFIAISVLVIDLIIIDHFSPYLREKINLSHLEFLSKDSDLYKKTEGEAENPEKECNVRGINLHGNLVTYTASGDYNDFDLFSGDQTSSELVYFILKNAEKNDDIKAIVIEIDSGGGDPTAGEEIAKALKNSSKPVIAYIRSVGASSAYWSATGADRIFALESSDVGSISITSSYLDSAKANQEEGLNFNELSTGKFKNTLNRNKGLTEEERILVMGSLQKIHDLFVRTVSENRGLEISQVEELATGWAYNGADALEYGLIDEIGGLDEVNNYLKDNVLEGADVEICW